LCGSRAGENLGARTAEARCGAHAPAPALKPEVPYSPTGLAAARQPSWGTPALGCGAAYFLHNYPACPRSSATRLVVGLVPLQIRQNAHLPPISTCASAQTGGGRLIGHPYSRHDTAHAPDDARAGCGAMRFVFDDGPNCHGPARGIALRRPCTRRILPRRRPRLTQSRTRARAEQNRKTLAPGPLSSRTSCFARCGSTDWISARRICGHARIRACGAHDGCSKCAARIAARLRENGAATIYVSDVPPATRILPRAVVGNCGGLHRLAPMPRSPPARKNLHVSITSRFRIIRRNWIACSTKQPLRN